jgi:uncharacterized protein YfaQ (DUF2300 family)
MCCQASRSQCECLAEHGTCGRAKNLDRLRRENEDIERSTTRRKTMSVQRKHDSAELKTRVALEAIKGYKTVNESASA